MGGGSAHVRRGVSGESSAKASAGFRLDEPGHNLASAAPGHIEVLTFVMPVSHEVEAAVRLLQFVSARPHCVLLKTFRMSQIVTFWENFK
jgi:hypothetical protein